MGNEGKFWRVYRDEWTVAYVSDADGNAGQRECMERSAGKKDGSFRLMAWSETDPNGWPWMLEVRFPVMKGEFMHRGDAATFAAEVGGIVVREGSTEDKEMLRRCQSMLAAAKSGSG